MKLIDQIVPLRSVRWIAFKTNKKLRHARKCVSRKQHRISQDTGIEEKHCGKCDAWKPLEAYNKDKTKWDNLQGCCKACRNAASKKRQRELYATEEGRKRIRASCRKSQKKRKMNGKKNAYERKRRKNDPTYRLKGNLSTNIYNGLRRQGIRKKPGRTIEFIGCSYAELMDHLESLFEPGMTRENYGSVWHVDHIVPRAAFAGTENN